MSEEESDETSEEDDDNDAFSDELEMESDETSEEDEEFVDEDEEQYSDLEEEDYNDFRHHKRKLSAPSPPKKPVLPANDLADLRKRYLAGKTLSSGERKLLAAHLRGLELKGENVAESERRLISRKKKRKLTRKPTRKPTRHPTKAPLPPGTPTGCSILSKCSHKKTVPTRCEVDLLIEMLEFAVNWKKQLSAQWLRLSFHDAATFNQDSHEGGSNGCLMNDHRMERQEENLFLGLPVHTLKTIKKDWFAHPFTCLHVSSADLIQFAGHFAAIRAVGTPGMTASKKNQLYRFQWGRPDEKHCRTEWAKNIPGFENGADGRDIPHRCLAAGKEIKEKMIDGHGFTAEEATVLIGAHTIGQTRFSFTGLLRAPWVLNGNDDATKKGPVFDNEYFKFLAHQIYPKTISEFVGRHFAPFDTVFLDWFRAGTFIDNLFGKDLNYLDTDVVMAFPSQDEDVHPDFHEFTVQFAENNQHFLNSFFKALDKMSKLGVDEDELQAPKHCPIPCNGNKMIGYISLHEFLKHLGGAFATVTRNLGPVLVSLAKRGVRQITALFQR